MNILSIEAINLGPFKESKYEMGVEPKLLMIQGINNSEGSNKESNGSGKSFFFIDIPEWVLFGRLKGEWNNNIHNDEIIRVIDEDKREEEGIGTIVFELNNEIYKVSRAIKNGGSQSLKLLYKDVDGEWISHTKSSGIDKNTGKRINSIVNTQRSIDNLLGCNDRLFINSVCFEQDNMNVFAKSNKNERENLLGIAINKDKWLAYSIKSKILRDKNKEELSNHKYFLKQYDIEKIKKEKSEESFRLKENNQHLIDKELELQKLYVKLEENKNKLVELKTKKENTKKLILEHTELKRNLLDNEKIYVSQYNNLRQEKEKIQKIENTINDNQNELANLFLKYDEHVESINEINKKEFEDEIDNYKKSIYQTEKDIVDLQTNIKILDIEIARNKEIYCPGTKILCTNANNDKIKSVQRELKSEKFYQQRIIFNKKKLLEQNEKYYKELLDDYEKYLRVSNEIVELERKISNIDNETTNIAKSSNRIEEILIDSDELVKHRKLQINRERELLNRLEEEIKKYEEDIKESNKIGDVEYTINEITNKIDNIKIEIPIIRENTYTISSKIKFYEEKIVQHEDHSNKLVKLDEEARILDFTYKMYSKYIPHLLLTKAIPEIEYHAKYFIEKISNGRMDIDFITQKNLRSKDADDNVKIKDTFDIMVTLENKKYQYSLFSGGEKARIDVAIHLAYSMYLISRSGAKLETLFLDEVTGQIDKEGRELLIDLLKDLMIKKYFKKIFIISHDTEIKKLIDDQIIIRKTHDGSIIEKIY